VPWTGLQPRRFPAFERELQGISRQTMDDHYKLYEGYAKNKESRFASGQPASTS
jgi:hypothetical protein